MAQTVNTDFSLYRCKTPSVLSTAGLPEKNSMRLSFGRRLWRKEEVRNDKKKAKNL